LPPAAPSTWCSAFPAIAAWSAAGTTGIARASAHAAAIARIYNQGIEERIATFETEPRTPEDIERVLAERARSLLRKNETRAVIVDRVQR
jgi:hypothetical protein